MDPLNSPEQINRNKRQILRARKNKEHIAGTCEDLSRLVKNM